MRHLSKYAALCGISCVILASTATKACAEHIHDSHPTTAHGSGPFIRISLEDGSEDNSFPEVTLDTDVEDLLYEVSLTNNTCSEKTLSISETRSRTQSVAVNWDVGVTGTGTWAAEALFTKLEAKVEISVERGQSWTVTESEEFNITTSGAAEPCSELLFESWVSNKTASGTVTTGDHVIVCQCTGCGALVTNYCNEVVLSGTADGYSDHAYDWNEEELEGDCGCDD